MFTLNTGSYRALEEAFVKDVLARKTSDPLSNLLVLSPSGHQLTRLQTLLANRSKGFLNIQFLTFYALAERVLSEGPASEEQVVGEPAVFREIINDFLEGQGDVPFASRNALRRPGIPVPRGLPGALASTLRDLQDSGAKVVDCANVAREGHLGEREEHAVPILELNVLMYGELKKRGLRTSADFIRRATEALPKNLWIKNQKAIYLYGFYDLTGVQLDLILSLANHPNAKIYFPYEKGNPAYAYAEKLLIDPALTSKLGTGNAERGSRSSSLSISSSTLRAPHSALSVEAFSCSGAADEIWLAAKKILALADSGVPFSLMSLQVRTLDPYLNLIREVFEAHSIPFALHTEEPVGAWPLIKTARQALRGSLTPIPSPGGRGEKPPYLKTLSHRERVAEPGEAQWSDHVSHAKKLLTSSLQLPKSATAIEQRLWDGLFDAIDSLAQLDALRKPVSQARFLEVLEEKLEGLRIPLASDNVAGVQVMDVMKARGLSFEAVFLVGLNEKMFPRLIREDPFLSDHARGVLAQALGAQLGRKMDGFEEEQLLFQLISESAHKHLHLSCQRSDEEGKALVVSLYLHDFLKTQGLKLYPVPRTWVEKLRQVPPETLTPKEISVAFHREGRTPDTLYRQLGWNTELLAHLLRSQKEIESFGSLGAHDGLIGADNPQAKALLDAGLSPGTLRDIAQCPFKVFSRKVLELYAEEGEVEDGQITHTGRGKLIHKILQSFYQNNSKIIDLVNIADKEFKLFADEYRDLYPLAWQAEKARILRMLKRFIPLDLADQAATGFKPAYFETPMSGEINGIRVQGRVDRLDLSATSFRIVDYKTGRLNTDKVETQILKGKAFQLPVYLALAKTLLETQKQPAAKAGEAVFYHLEQDDATEEPLRIGPDFWKEHGERFYKNLAFLVKDIESGAFYIRPSDNRGYCEWCDYAAVCRKEHIPTQIRSENSPLRKKHEEAFTLPKKGS